ncbi:MAG: FkbM family methyltransferase [Planctomycetota bacterium]|jgi:FkbM family methyltransferase
MKVVHFAEFSPNQCGLYHTTKDLVKAEKGVGIDAHFVDVVGKDGICVTQPGGKQDGNLTTSDIKEAEDADLFVRHTTIPNRFENVGKPVVMAIHGRPESSLMLDEKNEIPVIQAFFNKGRDSRYKALFTFWQEHLPFWKHIIPEKKLHFVPAMVDLIEWRPGNVEPIDFKEHNGDPNILITDLWRNDVTPFDEIMAVAKFIKEDCPTARLHIAAAICGDGANVFYRHLRKEGVLGYASGMVRGIKQLYEASDVVVTPHNIATRVVRESLAMGVPVVSAKSCKYTRYCPGKEYPTIHDALKGWLLEFRKRRTVQRSLARTEAERRFNLKQTGLAVKKIFESILNIKSDRRKVFIDLGGHVGETVRRFYKEVDDANRYEIHTFEPHPESMKKMKLTCGELMNVVFHQAVVSAVTRFREMWMGSVNDADGSTIVKGKTTGGVDYANTINVKSISLASFIKDELKLDGAYVILKMNIEGAEYEIMQHILDKNLMPIFDQIYVQTHKHKIQGGAYDELEQKFRNAAEQHCVQLFMQDKGMARFQCEGVTP